MYRTYIPGLDEVQRVPDLLLRIEAGGFPEAVARDGTRRGRWFDSYMDTMLSLALPRPRRSHPPRPPAGVTSMSMSARRDKPLLAPGNEAEWARINEEEERQEAEFAASLSPAQRVAYGQKLSQQGVSLLVASVKAGHVPERALWS